MNLSISRDWVSSLTMFYYIINGRRKLGYYTALIWAKIVDTEYVADLHFKDNCVFDPTILAIIDKTDTNFQKHDISSINVTRCYAFQMLLSYNMSMENVPGFIQICKVYASGDAYEYSI